MGKFKGTKRECAITTTKEGYHALSANGRYEFVIIFDQSEKGKADSELFLDSLHTIQKCDLLPSELLEQRDELLDFVKKLINHWNSVAGIHRPDYVKEAKELITKIKTV